MIVFQFRLEGDRNDGEDYIKRIVAVAETGCGWRTTAYGSTANP